MIRRTTKELAIRYAILPIVVSLDGQIEYLYPFLVFFLRGGEDAFIEEHLELE